MNAKYLSQTCRGSALIAVTLSIVVLTTISGAVLVTQKARRNVVHQSSVWQECLIAAEAGVQQAMAQLEQGLAGGTLPTTRMRYAVNLPHAGVSSASAVADYWLVPQEFEVAGSKRTYYHILANGSVGLGGPRSLSTDGRDMVLRKLDFSRSAPAAVRKIHALARPFYNTDGALKANGRINMNNHNIFVDSFHSEETPRSNAGQPSLTMGQFNVAPFDMYRAHVTTNSATLNPGAAYIYGDALSNGGTIGTPNNVYGEVRDDYNESIAPVRAPSWGTAATLPVGVTSLTQVSNSRSFTGGTVNAPARYVVDSFRLSGNKTVTFDAGAAPGANYIEIYVKNGLSTKGGGSGDGQFVVSNGVYVTIYIAGDVALGGNGLSNNNNKAETLALYGVNTDAAGNVLPPTQSWSFGGTSRFWGTVYAPGANVVLNGGGSPDYENGGTYVGSIVAASAEMKGRVHIRYDEALLKKGLITRFGLVSWFEDIRPDGSFLSSIPAVP